MYPQNPLGLNKLLVKDSLLAYRNLAGFVMICLNIRKCTLTWNCQNQPSKIRLTNIELVAVRKRFPDLLLIALEWQT